MNPPNTSLRTIPGDGWAGAFAYAAGLVGIITFIALGLMYAIELPSQTSPRFFGPLSDLGSGLYCLLVIPVVVQLHRRLPVSAASRFALVVVVVLLVAGAAGSFLLVARVLHFVPATAAAMAALAAVAVWLVAACLKLGQRGDVPRRLARSGVLMGAAFLIGVSVVGLGFLLPAGWMQWAVFGLGGVIGLVGWIGTPIWFLAAGRALRAEEVLVPAGA
ncbi:hypothetical protein [Agromyces albus]|uniref:hypothetical protein n=1 Tax=Agromyces albus TaxID=205332 RepID=UPI002782DBBC|nr:hypothetical protein [Agromyces albus]MDQ0574421.1 MFS family permease [Agromyces albus]